MSVEIKIVKEKIEINNEDKRSKKTDNSENQHNKGDQENKGKLEIKKKVLKREELPFINIRKVSNLSDSIINYFAISISLFLYAAYTLEWFHLHDEDSQGIKFIRTYFIFAGITLYVIGILNWYEGKELLFLFDFIFSFLFIALFLKGENLGDISSR